MRARHQVSKLLLRQGLVWSGGVTWRPAHHAWLGAQRFDDVAMKAAYDSAYEAVVLAEGRRARLDKAIAAMAADSPWSAVVARLGCLRGTDALAGFALAVEIGDWERFTGASIGAYLGLVPSDELPRVSRSDHRFDLCPEVARQGFLSRVLGYLALPRQPRPGVLLYPLLPQFPSRLRHRGSRLLPVGVQLRQPFDRRFLGPIPGLLSLFSPSVAKPDGAGVRATAGPGAVPGLEEGAHAAGEPTSQGATPSGGRADQRRPALLSRPAVSRAGPPARRLLATC